MTQNELNQAFVEAAKEGMKEWFSVLDRFDHRPKQGMEFSKRLMIFAAVLCGATWLVAAVSWFAWREFPAELTQYTIWFFGAALPCYMLKTGYENREKIKSGKEGRDK